MKKLSVLLGLILVLHTTSFSQFCEPCLPEGIEFSFQTQIDNFQVNYPNCTKIKGDVTITSSNILNLIGLSVLDSIGGNLIITETDYLNSLDGLDNLNSIGGNLELLHNETLNDLTGFSNVTSIGGDLILIYNHTLTSLEGLENIVSSSISNLTIQQNFDLVSCEAQNICDYLSSPGGTVQIHLNAPGCDNPPEVASACGITLPCLPFGNYTLYTQRDIDSFQTDYPNCTEIKGNIIVHGALSSISNLNGLNALTSVEGNISISHIDSLYTLSGLANLTSVGGHFGVSRCDALVDLSGFDNLTTIGGRCSVSQNNGLLSFAGLENLISTGGLYIYHDNALVNLMGFDNLTFINGNVEMESNDELSSLSGLNNLESISGNLELSYNYELSNLSGLENLTSIGGYLFLEHNNKMTNLTGLSNLNSVGEQIDICNNDHLTSIKGLENIDPSTIEKLIIQHNDSLSVCAEESICNYLTLPNADVSIHNNASGCNSEEEVENACLVGVENESIKSTFSTYPNPFTISTTFEYTLQQPSIIKISIYNQLGELVEVIRKKQNSGKQQVVWYAYGQPVGVYYFRMLWGDQVTLGKIVIVR
ncbi:MAG: T9SS type A sorting domain-containing protein [Bacteroidota bacterium]